MLVLTLLVYNLQNSAALAMFFWFFIWLLQLLAGHFGAAVEIDAAEVTEEAIEIELA